MIFMDATHKNPSPKYFILALKGLREVSIKTSQKWLTVAIFQKWQDSSVALWIEIAVILNWR